MNNNLTLTNGDSSLNIGTYILFTIMGLLLLSLPLYCCLCYLLRYIIFYLNSYSTFTNIMLNNNNNRQNKLKFIYDCLFSSVASPKLTEIIIYPMIKIESTVVYIEN